MRLTAGTISIHDLRLYGRHGVGAQERQVGGEFAVDLTVGCPLDEAVATDQVETTVNYAELCRVVSEEMAVASQLLEHVAGRMARRILADFPRVDWVEVRVKKLNPPMGADCGGASVMLRAEREGAPAM